MLDAMEVAARRPTGACKWVMVVARRCRTVARRAVGPGGAGLPVRHTSVAERGSLVGVRSKHDTGTTAAHRLTFCRRVYLFVCVFNVHFLADYTILLTYKIN